MLTVGQPICERSGLLPHARVGWMLPSEEYLNWAPLQQLGGGVTPSCWE
jgi:hypothetical protein